MVHKFNPAQKGILDSEERRGFYDLHALVRWLGIRRGTVVADIGCGTGYCTIPLAALVGEEGRVYACDVSAEMLDALMDKVARWGIDNIVTMLSGENTVPVEDDSVDFVLLSMVVHELESPSRFFAEMKRILKRRGRIGIVEWKEMDSPPGPPLRERISMDKLKKLVEKNGFSIVKEKGLGPFHYAILAGRSEDLIMEKVERTAGMLIRELHCIREREMRSNMLAERLARVKAGVVVEILREICGKAAEKRPLYPEILESCLDIDRLRAVLGLEKMSRIYSIARKRGYDDVVRLLMNPPPKGKRYSEYDFVEGRERFDITLGEKRSLAKGFDRDTLDRIIYDEDPVVIKNLLANPRVTEMDVLKIASKRPVDPEVLKVVFESSKWSSRYMVKRALVLNPFTPTGIALGLVNFMRRRDLEMIASEGSLLEELRNSAREILRRNYKV